MRGQRKDRRKRHLRWGRVLFLVVALTALMTCVFWGTVWIYDNIINPPRVKPATADGAKEDTRITSRTNVLLLGVDDGDSEAAENEPKRTDAMVVLSFDPDRNEVAMLSLPRDTKVVLPGHRDYEKLNAAYAYGGAVMAKQATANLLRIPIHYYALLDWRGFIKVVDMLGGVELFVENDMYYEDPYANLVIDLKKGFQHLNGEQAGQYVRFRKDELGDIGRAQRQQRFMKAILSQALSVSNIARLPEIIRSAANYVETDMNTMTVIDAARSFKLIGDSSVKTGMLYGDFDDATGVSYWKVDRDDVEKSLSELGIPCAVEDRGEDDSVKTRNAADETTADKIN